MKRKKKEITAEYLMDYWLSRGHQITVAWLIENEPELIKTPKWYAKYSVSQTLHDQWYEWAINEIAKHKHWSKKIVKKQFAFDYLNVAPTVNPND